MSYYYSKKQLSQSPVSDIKTLGSEETFIVDLENKVDSLKNISTDINTELRKSKVHLSSLSTTFDSASDSIKSSLSNMNKMARGYAHKLPFWTLVLVIALSLFLFFVILKRLFSS